jgi:hypothetical protein
MSYTGVCGAVSRMRARTVPTSAAVIARRFDNVGGLPPNRKEHLIRQIFYEAADAHMSDDADDCRPRAALRYSGNRWIDRDFLADRALCGPTRPTPFGEQIIHDYYWLAPLAVGLGEKPALDEMRTNRLEITAADRSEVGKWSSRWILAGCNEVWIAPVRNVIEGKMTHCANSGDPGHRREIQLKSFVKCIHRSGRIAEVQRRTEPERQPNCSARYRRKR